VPQESRVLRGAGVPIDAEAEMHRRAPCAGEGIAVSRGGHHEGETDGFFSDIPSPFDTL
jgi:hypothetical protein